MNITVYTTKACASCKMVKNYLARKGLDFRIVDVEEDVSERQRIIELTGQMAVPVTTVDDQVIVGWNITRLVEALKGDPL